MTNRNEEGIRTYAVVPAHENGTGPGSAGQSGDTRGLPGIAEAGSESVEDAPDAGVAEVHVREIPEAGVPTEYLQGDWALVTA